MTTNETTAVRRERNGFPIEECGRCGGTGRFSFNPRDLDMCYGCHGSGVAIARGAVKHHGAWRDAVRAAVRVTAQHLQAGDTVRRWGTSDPITGRRYTADEMPSGTVAAVVVDRDAPDGWSTAPDGTRTDHSWRTTVTWTDGTVEAMGGSTLWHRTGVSVDPAPYIERADRGVAWWRANH